MDAVPSAEQPEETETVPIAQETEAESGLHSPPTEPNTAPITTTVHWYLEGSALGWKNAFQYRW